MITLQKKRWMNSTKAILQTVAILLGRRKRLMIRGAVRIDAENRYVPIEPHRSFA